MELDLSRCKAGATNKLESREKGRRKESNDILEWAGKKFVNIGNRGVEANAKYN